MPLFLSAIFRAGNLNLAIAGIATLIAVGGLASAGVHFYNKGWHAHEALVAKEIARLNDRIADYTRRDDQASIDADVLRDQGYQRALADLSAKDRCVVTPGMVSAFGRIKP